MVCFVLSLTVLILMYVNYKNECPKIIYNIFSRMSVCVYIFHGIVFKSLQ